MACESGKEGCNVTLNLIALFWDKGRIKVAWGL